MKKNCLFTFICFTVSAILGAQPVNTDSLQKILSTQKEDTNKVLTLHLLADGLSELDVEKSIVYGKEGLILAKKISYDRGISKCLNALGKANINSGNYNDALQYFQERLQVVIKMKDDLGIAGVYDNMGITYFFLGNIDTALILRKKGIEIYRTLKKDLELSRGYVWVGNIYMSRANYSLAQENFFKSLEICERINNDADGGYALVNISNIYRQTLQYDSAISYALAAREKFEKINNKIGIAASIYRLALVYSDRNKYDSAIMYLSEAKRVFQEVGNKYHIAAINDQLGNNYRKKGQHDSALVYLTYALKSAEEMGNKALIATTLGNTGILYKEQRNYHKALEYLTRAAAFVKEVDEKKNLRAAYQDIIEIYSQINLPDSVLKYFTLYREITDTIYNEQTNRSIAEMKEKYESNKKDQEIIRKQQLAEKEKQNKNLVIVLGIIILVAAGLSALFYFRRKQSQHKLKTNELENKALRSQLNPHFIFNALNSIQAFMNEHPETAQSHLINFSKLMREVLENSEKEFISLEDEMAMLKKYMDLENLRINNGFDYVIRIDPSIDQELMKVPPLILQPIVENAIWHGIAGREERGKIDIQIYLEEKILVCIIENHCAGNPKIVEIKQPEKKKSFGLKIVTDRLALLSKGRVKGFLKKFPLPDGMKVQLGIPV